MAITLQCPRCTHEQSIDDDRAGSEVPCKICHHLIQPRAPKAKPKPKLAPKSKPEASEGIQKGAPPVQAGKPPAAAKTKPAKSKKNDDEEDDGDDRPSPRSRRAKSDTGTMPYVLLFGGGFLLIALLCGGGGLGAYFLMGSQPNEPELFVENPPIEFANPPPVVFPNPPPVVINPIPNPPPIPRPQPLDANNPADVDRVLTALRGPARERGPALAWLNNANVNHPRRAEVAKQLEAVVEEAMPRPFGNDAVFSAYFKWATKDSFPTLLKFVEDGRFGFMERNNRHSAMRLLARHKEPRAVDAIVKRLPDHGDRQVAVEALIEIGSAAQPAVLKSFNHPDGATREAARRILQAYQINSDTLVTQCIADLNSTEQNRQREALQWLMKNPVEPKRKAELSKALNQMLEADNALANRDLVGALEAWGTSENTASLVRILDQTRFHHREAIRVLGKIGDLKSAGAIAKHLKFGFVGNEARAALKQMGSEAEPAVLEVFNTTTDGFSRMECAKCLGEIGTMKMSVPALRAMEARLPQDPGFRLHSQMAIKSIVARGK